MLVAAPYVKEPEAVWLCGRLRQGVDVLALANLDADAMAQASFDLAALWRLFEASSASRVVSLPTSARRRTSPTMSVGGSLLRQRI